MREWFIKPLLIVLAIVVVLGAFSIWWLKAGPARATAATAADHRPPTRYHQRLQEALNDLEDL